MVYVILSYPTTRHPFAPYFGKTRIRRVAMIPPFPFLLRSSIPLFCWFVVVNLARHYLGSKAIFSLFFPDFSSLRLLLPALLNRPRPQNVTVADEKLRDIFFT